MTINRTSVAFFCLVAILIVLPLYYLGNPKYWKIKTISKEIIIKKKEQLINGNLEKSVYMFEVLDMDNNSINIEAEKKFNYLKIGDTINITYFDYELFKSLNSVIK